MQYTVVSLMPFDITEVKPGLEPGIFEVKAGDIKHQMPFCLVINDSTCPLYLGDGKTYPTVEPAKKVAEAICKDFIVAQLEYVPDVAEPALFCVEGAYKADQVKEIFKKEIQDALKKQAEWFNRLVTAADDEWTKNKNSRVITDRMRVAARTLGLTREWLHKPTAESLNVMDCPACGSTISSTVAICKHCHTIVNVEKYKELQSKGQIRANA